MTRDTYDELLQNLALLNASEPELDSMLDTLDAASDSDKVRQETQR